MPAPPAQTPGTWLRAGGLSLSDAECRAALLACGLNPDEFGNYSQVLESQSQARKELRDAARKEAAGKETPDESHHVPPCNLPPGAPSGNNCRCHEGEVAQRLVDDDEFLHANAQSGHMSQDALNRAQGGREDPCQNIAPTAGNSGTYGYETSKARCMEHYGRSNLAGSPHEQICRAEEDFQADMARGKPPDRPAKGPLTQEDLREGVGRSAVVAATKGRFRVTDDGLQKVALDPAAHAEQQKFEIAQSGAAVANGASNPANTNPSKDMPGLTETEALAVKCIQADWEKSLAAMQTDSMQKNTLGSAAARQKAVDAHNADPANAGKPKAKNWDDLPPEAQKAAVAKRQQQLAQKMGNPPPTQENPAGSQQSMNDARSVENSKAKKEGRPADSSKWAGKPTKAECREYQANWLFLQTDGGKKGMPPMQGNNPTAPAPSPPPPTSPPPTTNARPRQRR